jgi:DNA gyrase subunit A
LALKSYADKPYLVLATKRGLIKKTDLTAYDSNRSGGLIAINLRDVEGEDGELHPDELVAARLVSAEDDLLLVSRKGQSIRFTADDAQLRPMGRATSGVTGMKFRDSDELLAADVVMPRMYSLVVTEGGYAKRSDMDEYRVQGRGGLGIKVAKLQEQRGDLVGALLVDEADEVLVIMESGKVMRSPVEGVPAKGRDTMGVIFAKPAEGDRIIGIARNVERHLDGDDVADGDAPEEATEAAEGE